MFHQDASIQEVLTCPVCQDILTDPKILTCETTACEKCIKKMTVNDQVKCRMCNKIHLIPEQGFIENKIVIELMNKKPKEVNHNESVDELRNKLKLVKQS